MLPVVHRLQVLQVQESRQLQPPFVLVLVLVLVLVFLLFLVLFLLFFPFVIPRTRPHPLANHASHTSPCSCSHFDPQGATSIVKIIVLVVLIVVLVVIVLVIIPIGTRVHHATSYCFVCGTCAANICRHNCK
jgi:NADH:ubiquinone oxidoreductase subunit 3 (subunit A)